MARFCRWYHNATNAKIANMMWKCRNASYQAWRIGDSDWKKITTNDIRALSNGEKWVNSTAACHSQSIHI